VDIIPYYDEDRVPFDQPEEVKKDTVTANDKEEKKKQMS
jgi:hypothetical protein